MFDQSLSMATMARPADDVDGPTMADAPRTHKLDVDSLNGGRVFLLLGLLFGPIGTITGIQAFSEGVDPAAARPAARFLLMGVTGLLCIPIGVWALRLPTAGASVRIDSEGLAFTLRRAKAISIPWSAVGSWGLAPRLWRLTNSLVLWPSPDASPEVCHAARKLWNKKYQGWVVEAIDPGPQLVADLEALAPPPRRDLRRQKRRH